MSVTITPCTWKHGKRWVYTVTYDEALVELHEYTIPIHEELGIPGHVEVVVGHMGVERQIGASSYNGYHHMNGSQLRELIDMGWGVGNHSWSHGVVADNLDLELRQAKEVLEDAIGHRVVAYCAPGDNSNLTPTIIDALREYGYLCGMSVTDDVNPPDGNLWFLNRAANLHQGWGPLYSAFEPEHRLAQARRQSAWVIDYCHCPSPKIPHENKDVYLHEHRARLEAIVEVGGCEVWTSTVEEVTDYILCRRGVKIAAAENGAVELSLQDVPEAVSCRDVTFDLEIPPAQRRCPLLVINGQPQPATLVTATTARVTLDLSQPVILSTKGVSQ
jgi:hypothetical protein